MVTHTTAAIRTEILQVAEAVAREKGIERTEIISALEEAIQKAARAKYGNEFDIRAHISQTTGQIEIFRHRCVVETVEDEATQISSDDCKFYNPDLGLGEDLIEPLPPIDLGRISAQSAKQVILQRLRDAERRQEYERFIEQKGSIISGAVKRIEYGNIIVDLGSGGEGLVRRNEVIPREFYQNGDRIRAYIVDVRQEQRGPQIFLSRTHPEFMAKLFTQEVPEIYDNIIQIKGVARDAGSRAKIAVYTEDPSIDPVGACVGVRGSRVQAVINELQGEKIDIIPWTEDIVTFVINALAPATVSKVVLDEENNRIEVVVPQDQLSLAIGRRGQNVRLASILTKLQIDIMDEEREAEERAKTLAERSELFIAGLDVEDVIAHLLVAEGFTSINEIADVSLEELASIEGFDEDVAEELQRRAQAHLQTLKEAHDSLKAEKGIQEDLYQVEDLKEELIFVLADKGIKSRDDLADLATDELLELLGPDVLSEKEATDLIMKARAHWFAEEEISEAAEVSTEDASKED